jgi:hypothetical protein
VPYASDWTAADGRQVKAVSIANAREVEDFVARQIETAKSMEVVEKREKAIAKYFSPADLRNNVPVASRLIVIIDAPGFVDGDQLRSLFYDRIAQFTGGPSIVYLTRHFYADGMPARFGTSDPEIAALQLNQIASRIVLIHAVVATSFIEDTQMWDGECKVSIDWIDPTSGNKIENPHNAINPGFVESADPKEASQLAIKAAAGHLVADVLWKESRR